MVAKGWGKRGSARGSFVRCTDWKTRNYGGALWVSMF